MHEGEVDTGEVVVRSLLAEQLPQLADLPLRPLDTAPGTVNAVWRLGEHLSVRLPRVAGWDAHLAREQAWLPRLGPQLSVAVPRPVHAGRPSARFPFSWAVFDWIEGDPWSDAAVDEVAVAHDLAGFVRELRAVDVAAGPPGGRRPLVELDAGTREGIELLEAEQDDLDRAEVADAWQRSLEAPAWDGTGATWVHADLLRPNLLVSGGRLRAVLDFGGAGVGDPAADVIAAWTVLSPPGRAVFREELEVDDGTWARARGVALHQAVMIVGYYRTTNPGFAAAGRRTIAQVLGDDAAAVDGRG